MIKKAEISDADALAALAIQLWPDNDLNELTEEFRGSIQNADAACFIKYAGGEPVAFAECRLRHDYVGGTDSSPVGDLGGVYVKEGFRRQGCAAQLLAECENWAGEKGCTEFASDCELDNAESLRFHKAMGFEETSRIICFRKALDTAAPVSGPS